MLGGDDVEPSSPRRNGDQRLRFETVEIHVLCQKFAPTRPNLCASQGHVSDEAIGLKLCNPRTETSHIDLEGEIYSQSFLLFTSLSFTIISPPPRLVHS
jgi:hypothetical protein